MTAILLVAASATAASATVFTVGADPVNCTHSDLQTALDEIPGQPGDQVRLSNDRIHFVGDLVVRDKHLDLVGGFASCTSTGPSGTTELIGDFDSSVLALLRTSVSQGGDTVVRSVSLRNLVLRGGKAMSGGGVQIVGAYDVVLQGLHLHHNEAVSWGGGLFVDRARATFVSTLIEHNEAGSGGGITCLDCELVFDEKVRIANNSARDAGGGVHVVEGFVETLTGVKVTGNIAGQGGGMHLYRSEATIVGSSGVPVVFEGNQGQDTGAVRVQGAGLYVGSGSHVEIGETRFVANRLADTNSDLDCGGGLAVGERSTVALLADEAGPVVFDGNQAKYGSAACVKNADTVLTVHGARFEGNRSFGLDSYSVIHVTREGRLHSEGALLTGNRALHLFAAVHGGDVTVAHTTTYLNDGPGDQELASIVRSSTGAGPESTARLYSSILWEAVPGTFQPLQKEGASTVVGECLMISGTPQGLPPMTHLLTGGWSDIWQNAGNGNFRLHPDSPAIDFCDASVYEPQWTDYDGGVRGVDDPHTTDHYAGARFDLGVDELGSDAGSGPLFSNGFESGDLSGWQ